MKKHILYKAIFTSGDQKETVEMEADGNFYQDPYRVIFNYKQTHIEIEVHKDNIVLKNNDSILHLNTKETVFNNYQLPYGFAHFKTRVDMFEKGNDHLYLKYVLFDDVSEITQAYIKINIKDIILPN